LLLEKADCKFIFKSRLKTFVFEIWMAR
jgi:hypothetical protein